MRVSGLGARVVRGGSLGLVALGMEHAGYAWVVMIGVVLECFWGGVLGRAGVYMDRVLRWIRGGVGIL